MYMYSIYSLLEFVDLLSQKSYVSLIGFLDVKHCTSHRKSNGSQLIRFLIIIRVEEEPNEMLPRNLNYRFRQHANAAWLGIRLALSGRG